MMTTRHVPLVFVLLLGVFNMYGQSAMHETQFYFEDNLGNKDSITIGFDPLADYTFNPQFGEIEINEAFIPDSFEIRASRPCLPFFECLQTKKIITRSNLIINHPDNCYSVGNVIIWINSKNFPIKVSWDKLFFSNNQCIQSSFLTKSYSIEFFSQINEPIYLESNLHRCLGQKDFWIINELGVIQNNDHDPFMLEITNSKGSLDTIYGIDLFYASDIHNVQCEVLSNINEVSVSPNNLFSIYPNPVSSELHIQKISDSNKIFRRLIIFDSLGREVYSSFSMEKINLRSFPTGNYFLQIMTDQMKEFHKFYKL